MSQLEGLIDWDGFRRNAIAWNQIRGIAQALKGPYSREVELHITPAKITRDSKTENERRLGSLHSNIYHRQANRLKNLLFLRNLLEVKLNMYLPSK